MIVFGLQVVGKIFPGGARYTSTALHFKFGRSFFLQTIPFSYTICGVRMTARKAGLHGRIERTLHSLRPTNAWRPLPRSGMPAATQ
ncbi:hypothetical protein [Paraburkholderia flagellata]|uniref:hypothetical protein n=1 Tax=Paraburkholderia flagellata TaxID=2883241 RepID=UPI001F3ADA29|nr:hypothetical protein [Paraburkholderia flagellata]